MTDAERIRIAGEIRARHLAGEKVRALAAEYKLDYRRAHAYATAKRVPGRRHPHALPLDDVHEIQELLARGMKQKDIAEWIGCSQQAVSRAKVAMARRKLNG